MGSQTKGVIFNIQRYSVHDGPGIRTIVFLKGCPLRCLWCCNPESQQYSPQIAYNREKCLGCLRCMKICPGGAISTNEKGIRINRSTCPAGCDLCAETCPAKALMVYGQAMTAMEALDEVEKDAAFYARSGGGLTLSGGEPSSQADFCNAILEEADRRAIHTAMETSGYTQTEKLLEICKKLDYLLYDIKHLDREEHKRITGVDNELILNNLRKIRSHYPHLPIHLRTPLIPEINDEPELIGRIIKLAKSINAVKYELLPYHRMGEQKYSFLDRGYPYQGPDSLDDNRLALLKAMVNEFYAEEDENN